jgi:hypothetical protein
MPVILATQEDHGLRPIQAKRKKERPYLKKTQYKKGLAKWIYW